MPLVPTTFQNRPFRTHILENSNRYVLSDWTKMEIPKLSIQDHIYIILTLIYVPLIGQNWKSKKR